MVAPTRSRYSGVLAVLLCAFAGNIDARQYDYETVKSTYADQITTVMTCGEWRDGSQSGTYRVMEAVVYTQSVLFVQWLSAPDPDTGLTEIRATYAPTELNDDHADISLSDLRCKNLRKGIRITAHAYSGNENRRGKLDIEAAPEPGRARTGLRWRK